MRRKQPVTPQRRSEPRQQESGTSGQAPGQFSAFAANDERSGPGIPGRPAVTGAAAGGSGAGPSGSAQTEERTPPSGRYDFLSPINWRVPTRLVAILLIPVIIALVFGGLRVNTSLDDYNKADKAVKTAQLARAATELADALESERDLSVIPLMYGKDDQGLVPKLRAKTDQALAAYRTAYAKVSGDQTLDRRNAAFQQLVVFLPHLRDNAYKPELFATATASAYSAMFAPLLAMDNSVGFGSSSVTSKGRAIYAMSLAKASASTQRALMLNLLVGVGTNTVTRHENEDLIQTLLVANRLEGTALSEFNTASDPSDIQVWSDAQVAQAAADERLPLRMPDNHTLPTMQGLMNIGLAYTQAAIAGQQPQAGQSPQKAIAAAAATFAAAQAEGLNVNNWLQATTSRTTALRNTENALLEQVVGDAQNIKDRARTDWILNSAIVLASLILAGLFTGFIARSMILGMRTLNTAALDIANHRLPDLVDKLSKTDPERVDTSVAPIPLWGKDEIGEVARAFDQVHSQAVSLAAEQALLRGNLNAIFSNLSRRSQSLIQRQLALITDLENNEADPDQLENLFKLDHLATRMRRNGENLLVLAGEEPGRRWNTPVPLVDVLRAAASEVEQYERIELAGIPEAEVIGAAVTDLVHLLAELLENATSFSSPQTRVLVNATRLPDGRVLVEIHDKGIGLTAEDFAEINEKLAEPPTVDVTISRRMGLFVVGRLSQRHDIRVQLRPSGESAGTTSLVMLPQALTQLRHAPEPQEEEFTVSRIFADQSPTGEWSLDGPQRSAAELGFDDHLTGQGGGSGFSPALESVQRSQRLEEQRRVAALESGSDEPLEAEILESPYGEETGREPYGDAPYAPDGYQQQQYAQDGFQQDPYGRDQYAQDEFQGYQQNGYQQDPYGRDQYGQDGYQQQYAQDGYGDQQYAEAYDQGYGYDEPAGHPYGQDETPALPPARSPQDGPGSGLPQRRPGEQLAGGAAARALGGARDSFGGGEEKPNWFTGAKDTSAPIESRGHDVSALGGYGPTGPTAAQPDWQSPNDGDWQRAEQLREPASGGTTSAGLPRRVPKQNLVPGNAKPGPQDGPQVSRDPNEVRGRLTNLRRGVEQGRSAGGDPGATGSFRIDPDLGRPGNGQHNSSTDLFGGSNHQER
ncbi:sensor histidine kinase [Kitasatospora cinereorecta]|uniref:histidine kinase n=1 Tax=Kitasatospora cinereorecta TaxID=285560 RepID=A0ABW0VNI3_9ACTN